MSNIIHINGRSSSSIEPNKEDIKTFMHVVFGNCSGLIPLRSFAEKGNTDSKSISNSWIKADDEIVNEAFNFAKLANRRQGAFYVISGTVSKRVQAGSADIVQMQTLLIDIDDGDTESKLAILENALGQATMIVESGGITAEGHVKLHIYWQLSKAVSGEDLQLLIKLRHQIALAVGGDIHFKSAHQPIRVAGSVYHKGGEVKPVKIRSYNLLEYDLGELIDKVSYLSTLNNNTSISGTTALNSNCLSISQLLISKVYEGGSGEQTRFNNIRRIIGYWLQRYHVGLISREEAIEEIHGYNLANMVPPWSTDKVNQAINSIWKLHVEKYGQPNEKKSKVNDSATTITSFSLGSFLADDTQLPEDIISPRILTPGGIFVFGGAPKVGKSDFLLSLLAHMAAGEEFIGFTPPRPLKIFYFQAEIGYHYLRERLQNMQLPQELVDKACNNLCITPNSKLLLNEQGIETVAVHIQSVFPDKPDIIAVDPIRNVFDGGRVGATENENDAMMFFLQKRVEALRDKVNPEAGIILVHHTKKISGTLLDEDPFQAFSGASSLRGYYTTGALLYKPDLTSNNRHLVFELRNGAQIPTKILDKKDGKWIEENPLNKRMAHKTQGKIFDRERDRRITVIISILQAEGLKGKFYLMKQFAEKFQNHKDLGGRRAIYDDCSAAATKGYIKFFDNPKDYGLKLENVGNASFGFMCIEGMRILSSVTTDFETGEIAEDFKMVLPTHYKLDNNGRKRQQPNPEIW